MTGLLEAARLRTPHIAALLALLCAGTAMAAARAPDSMVRVRVTRQAYHFLQPWQKRPPTTASGIGAVIAADRVLVTAQLVRDATFVEIETIRGQRKIPAEVVNVDYLGNLAVVRPREAGALAGMRPLKVRAKSRVGDSVDVWQFEENGTPALTTGDIKTIEVSMYPTLENAMLVYRVRIGLSSLGGSYTLPVLQRGKLVGMLLGHSQSNQSMTLVPGPVIKHYLDDLADGKYAGFPRAMFAFMPLQDPQLRRYVNMPDSEDGVLITAVRPGGPAKLAGLERNDVLLSVNGFAVDRQGQYEDPDFGRQTLAHLTTTRSKIGDLLICRILRDGEQKVLELKMTTVDPRAYPVPPYLADEAPEYLIVGGFVFQELSQEMLRVWGGEWQTSAPPRLVQYQRHQWERVPAGERVVVLTHTLPARSNVGYHQVRFVVVSKANGTEIGSLRALRDALATPPAGGLHRIDVEEQPKAIYIDAAQAATEDRMIQELYQLPALSRFNE
jgi:S1-C subfamily serine protease